MKVKAVEKLPVAAAALRACHLVYITIFLASKKLKFIPGPNFISKISLGKFVFVMNIMRVRGQQKSNTKSN